MLSSVLGNSFLKPYSCQTLTSVKTWFFIVTWECRTNWARELFPQAYSLCSCNSCLHSSGHLDSNGTLWVRCFRSATPISHGDVAEIQNGVTFLCLVSGVQRELGLSTLMSAKGHLSDQGSWGSFLLSPQHVTMSLAGWASTWDVETSVPLGLSWGQITWWCFLCTFSLMDSERWAPPKCDYRNNCLMLLFWLILKSSLSVSVDYFWSLAIHISHKNLFAEWLRRQVPNWHSQSPCCGQASFSCWNVWAGWVLSKSLIKSGIKPKNPSWQIFFFFL